MTTSRLEINLSAIDRNVRLVREVLVDHRAADDRSARRRLGICAVIKQDAYGMGAARIAKRLESAGVDMLSVYCLDEARALVEEPLRAPILVLMPVDNFDRADPLYRLASCGRLHLTLHSEQQAMALSSVAARIGVTFPVHVQVDTGLSRGGCLPDEAARVVEFVASSNRFRLAGVMTHFSSPGHDDAFTREQARLFRVWLDRVSPMFRDAAGGAGARPEPVWVHAANTAATFRSDKFHALMVRLGQGLLGYGADALAPKHSEEEHDTVQFREQSHRLSPSMRWLSRIVHVQEVPEGWPVGYNRLWHAPRPSRIGIVPVGYADGFPITLSGADNDTRAVVRLTGRAFDRTRTVGPRESTSELGQRGGGVFVPVVGRVSMDQITVDLTDAPEDLSWIGAEVEVIGDDPAAPNAMAEVARRAGTITHQLLCAVSPTLERVYVADVTDEAGPSGQIGGGGVSRLAAHAAS